MVFPEKQRTEAKKFLTVILTANKFFQGEVSDASLRDR